MSYSIDPISAAGVRQLGVFNTSGNGHVAVWHAVDNRQKEIYAEETFQKRVKDLDDTQKAELTARFPNPKDVMKDFVGKKIGNWSNQQWNEAQKNGDIAKLERLVRGQFIADAIFFLPIFINTLKELRNGDRPTAKIINTQAMGLKAMLLALGVYNILMKRKDPNWKNAKMELWLTDLPEKGAIHFFGPIKGLSKLAKKNLILVTPKPRWGENESLEFLKKETGLSEEQICILEDKDLPVDPIYKSKKIQKGGPGKAVSLTFNLNLAQKHDELLKDLPNLGVSLLNDIKPDTDNKIATFSYKIEAQDKVYSLIMGSQPSRSIVQHTIKELIELVKEKDIKETIHLFALCGRDLQNPDKEGAQFPTAGYLLTDVCNELKKQGVSIPANLKIVPLPAQTSENTAMIQARADKRFGRASGASSYEHKVLKHQLGEEGGEIFLFSETTKKMPKELQEKDPFSPEVQEWLLQFIPVWEESNAHNLIETMGAKIISKDTFKDAILSPSHQPVSPIIIGQPAQPKSLQEENDAVISNIEELEEFLDQIFNDIKQNSSDDNVKKLQLAGQNIAVDEQFRKVRGSNLEGRRKNHPAFQIGNHRLLRK